MPIAAAGIGAAGAIGGSLIGASAARDAANTQAQAAGSALRAQRQIYRANKRNLMPYMRMGNKAAASLAQLYGLGPAGAAGISRGWDKFTQLPAYTFPLQQGMLALTRNLNAQGLNMSGAQLREAQQFGQGLASQYMMSNYVSPLQSFMQTGAGAAGNLAGVNANMANTMGNTMMGVGQAQAAGTIGQANAWMSAFPNTLAGYSMLSKMPMGGGIGGGFSSYANMNSGNSGGSLPGSALTSGGGFW